MGVFATFAVDTATWILGLTTGLEVGVATTTYRLNLTYFSLISTHEQRLLVSINVQLGTLAICFHLLFAPALIHTIHKLLYIIFRQYFLSIISQ